MKRDSKNSNQSNKNEKPMKYDNKTTKPTKPDFTQQTKENEENKHKKHIPIGLRNKNSRDCCKFSGGDHQEIFDSSGKIVFNSQVIYKGLNNYGNMCYSNVIMQSMVSIVEFVDMLNSIYDKVESECRLFSDLDFSFKYPALYNLVKIMNFYQGR